VSLTVVIILPLLMAAGIARGGVIGRACWQAAPWVPLLLIWPLARGGVVAPEWMLIGFTLGVDEVTAAFVILVVTGWTLAGWQARSAIGPEKRGFWIGWLLCLAGMTLAVFSLNLVSFYFGYVLLSLSAWLLIIHARTDEAWRAARIYLVMAFVGEAAILSGVLILAGLYGNFELATLAGTAVEQEHVVARWLLLAGFAIKLGIIPLHMWLPLAHPIAPVPASAVLSGIIVKAGLLGWLRLVPQTGLDHTATGNILMSIGLVTAFGGVVLGLAQTRLKTVLAYSTISQMGLVLIAFSLLFRLEGDPAVAMMSLLGLIMLHHGLNKMSLFLACGNAPGNSRWRLFLFALPALSLAAAPLTTGYAAKYWLKQAVGDLDTGNAIYYLLALTSAATAVLMWRAWQLARETREPDKSLHPAWPLAVFFAVALPWIWSVLTLPLLRPSWATLFDAAWPLLLAAVIIAAGSRLFRGTPTLPEGDIVVVLEAVARRIHRPTLALPSIRARRHSLRQWLGHIEELDFQLRELPAVGLALLVAGGMLWWVIYLGLGG
jgi:formate hydrogenlyase subunit 3/multisubunit Na+/H+ antiporter MnhD subunit